MIFDEKFESVKNGNISISDVKKDKKGIVVIFMSIQCPYAMAYYGKIEGIANNSKYSNVIGFLLVNSNDSIDGELETIDEMRNDFKHLLVPYIKDNNKELLKYFKAVSTPHCFLINNDNQVIYNGAIDAWFRPPSEYSEEIDEQGFPWDDEPPASPQYTYLEEVLDAYIVNKEIPYSHKTSIGCSIK